MLTLKLFGGFKLSQADGQPAEIDLAKSRAMIAYLALNRGKAIDRSLLASLLWGSQPEDRARHSLTQTLSSISRALGECSQGLERHRQSICLKEAFIEVDVSLLDDVNALTDDELISIIDSFELNCLADFSFGEPAFDEWVLMIHESLQERLLQAGSRLLSLESQRRDSEITITVARKLLRIDPFFEPAHRALIGQLLEDGDSVSARQQARICEETLRTELGVVPGPATQQVIDSIQRTSVNNQQSSEPDNPERSLPQTPSIVVLALQNLTGDSALQHICQGLSDDITTELVRYRSLFVISRESAFQLPVESADIGDLSRRLGVRHCLCGSLRLYRGKFRINLRLVEGATGQTVWAENYDVTSAEVLEISDDVVANLVSRLNATMEEEALVRTHRTSPSNWTAYDHLLQGLVYHHKSWYGTGMLYGAVKHFTRAVQLDPELARAHAYLSCAISAPWHKDRELSSLDRCIMHAKRAIEIDPFEAEAQRVIGGVYLVRGEHELANHHFNLALNAHPGNAHVLAHAAKFRTFVGEPGDAVSLVNKARQLNPLHPAWYWQHLGIAMFDQRNYDQSIRIFNRLPFLVFFDRLYLASANAHIGNHRAATYHLDHVRREKPELNRNNVGNFLPYKSVDSLANIIEGLEMANL